jgi:taurine-pyruvate aminotransferase
VPGIRALCDKYGIILIFDEVVSGFGRTGKMFGHQHWNTQADIYTFAKGLASGYMPIAATVAKEHIFEGFLGKPAEMRHFRQINTFGGHTVSTAVAMRNVQIVEEEDLTGNAAKMGQYFRDQIDQELGDHPFIGEVRGLGLLTGIELVEDRATKVPLDEARLNVVIGTCVQNGVIMGRNTNTIPGRCNVLLVAPPLVVNQAETDQIVEAIKKGLNAALG